MRFQRPINLHNNNDQHNMVFMSLIYPNTGSLTIYEPLNTQRSEEVEAAILREALRRGRTKDHLKAVRRRCLGAERKLEEALGAAGQSEGGRKRKRGRYILVVRFVVSAHRYTTPRTPRQNNATQPNPTQHDRRPRSCSASRTGPSSARSRPGCPSSSSSP